MSSQAARNLLAAAWHEDPRELVDPLFEHFRPRISAEHPPVRLARFVSDAFPYVEPANPYVHGRHIERICLLLERLTYFARDHLSAAGLLTRDETDTWREVENLLVNIPPRYMKSLLIAVLWPAWVWTIDPGARFLFNSYIEKYAIRDNLKTRRLVESAWYRNRWGERVRITTDQNEKMRFELEGGGFRQASSVGGGNTGEGGDYVGADDPHNANEIWSTAKRQTVLDWWDEVMASRTGRFARNRRVVVMQRLHEEDLSGHLLDVRARSYVHVFLPQEYNPHLKPGRAGAQPLTAPSPIGRIDWRTVPGELLWPERFNEAVVADIKANTTAYALAGQYQQVPSPPEGDLFKRVHWRFWEPPTEDFGPVTMHLGDGVRHVVAPRKLPWRGQFYAQSWDFTFKGPRPGTDRDYVAGWQWFRSYPDVYVMDRIHQRMDFTATLEAIKAMRRRWPATQRVWYEDAANGPAVASVLRSQIPGLIAVPARDSLEASAHAVSWVVESGHVYLPHPVMCPWVNEVIDLLAAFPEAAHDDDVTALCIGLRRLYPTPPTPEDSLRRAGRYPVFQSRA